ncbi:MAG: WD40/YVTN/BNR-like repeat-containing protein, partial [Candidatus Acidiferrales bacterium]
PNCASGVFKSNDGGKTFAALGTPAFCNNQCFYDMAVGINPAANSKVIFLGGGPAAEGSNSVGALSAPCGNIPANQGISAVIESTDGGQTWKDVSCDNPRGTFIHVDTHAFAFGPSNKFYIGNDGGVWSSTDVTSNPGGQSWADLNNSLSLTQFYPGNSIHPSNPQIGFAGAQDNGMQEFNPQLNPSAPLTWTDTASCGDGAWTAIDPITPSTVYTTCEAIGNFGTVNKNQMDGTGVGNGVNWIPLDTPAMDSDNTNFIPPMVVDPTQPQNVYFGTFRVWQSATGGLSWSPISLPQCGSSSCVLTTLAVAPNASGTVYAGADTGAIWVSTNATGSAPTFTEINQNNMPQRTVTQVLASPMNSQIAFASFSGFSGFTNPNTNLTDTVGHLFETQNGGGTWTDISCHTSNCLNPLSTDLPNTPVNDVVVDPNDMMNKTLYVATDVGVFMTSNGGGSWIELASGLPHVECTSLKLNNTARVLRVGTHGRGVWDLQLNGLPASALTGISPTSATAGTQGVAPLTLTGQGLPNNPTVMFGTTSLAGSGGGTQVTVSVPASALVNPGVVQVSVASAAPSTGLGFSIEGPVPTLSQISPTSAKTGANITLTVTGSNFNPKSEVVWTPATGTGVNVFVSTVLPQLPGGTSTSFSVTVPASLLASSLAKMVPVAPTAPKSKGPGAFWLLAALCAGIIGILVFAAVPRKRRLIFGTTLTTVLVLLLIGGCSGVGSNNNPPPPPPNSVNVAVDVFNQAPGGGFEPVRQQQTITVSQ